MTDPGGRWLRMAKETLGDITPERREEIEQEIREAELLAADSKNYPAASETTPQPAQGTQKKELGRWKNGSGADRATAEKNDEQKA